MAGQSLTGKLDLLVGGGETRSLGTCSMGFAVGFVNTQGKYEEGFVTAGHCNNGSTGDEYHINATNFRDVYGVSIWNALPNGVDAQYVRKTGSLADLGIGLIGRPTQENTSGQAYLDLDARDPYFRIIGKANPIVRQTVHKVGRTTGWTSGSVTSTCTTFVSLYAGWPALPCMGTASYGSAGGDSGGPVFSLNPDGSAMAMGIHHGS